MKDLFSVAGKIALVTGGSRGIGAMIAEGFLRSGAKVYITSRKAKELEETRARLSEFGECIAITSDLSQLDGITALAADLANRESKLDILINNAGATWGANIDEFPESGWDKVMDLNVKSVFFLSQKLLPLLRAAASNDEPARIVNLSSIYALRYSHQDTFSYSASKAAVIQLTQQLAARLVKDNINVNAIAPGMFPSSMTAFLMEDEEALNQSIPMHRVGKLEDAAGTVIYLCSRASSYMTGGLLVIDGGTVISAG
ncbi:SDR family oxidoreductase [Zhongshania sp. BJYM1]|jgi:NAD(P)-dependent dehydrogenase (short-subunit alcohol dehydrogenase family)|uniref:SDR family oxidoreductase n=1 Tax=Zhongshania aquatica TaxID=2965069 RepID=UPI0022B330AD|nr:SDR family oxidoreductase [Marortus sp. BJYM1]